MKIITSWDDGHPVDLRLAELLDRYKLKGTFFIPLHNVEDRPVMDYKALHDLDWKFEIGSHTQDHCYLDSMDFKTASNQIYEGKTMLEDILGHEVPGFAYPGGKYNRELISLLPNLGIEYARTIENLCDSLGESQFRIPTTIQFHPHFPTVFIKNFFRYNGRIRKAFAFYKVLSVISFSDRLMAMADWCGKNNAVFHLWGHSWEIEELGLWDELTAFFEYLNSLEGDPLTIHEALYSNGP